MSAPGPKRIPSLDGLRAFSVAFVLLGHLAGTTGAPGWLRYTDPYANFGVRVFFVISGYLITMLLLSEHRKTSTIDLKAFYERRLFRIFPAAYVFMAVIAVVFWSALSRTDLLVAFAYLSNYHEARTWDLGHLWSLAVEEQFYLLWPLLLMAAFRLRIHFALAAILIAPLVRAALLLTHHSVGAQDWFPSLMDALATGCLLALVRDRMQRWDRILRSPWMLVAPAFALALVQIGESTVLGRATFSFYQVVCLPVVHACIALTIDHVVRRPYWLLNWPPVAWVGVLSYSLYLWQQPFLPHHSDALLCRYPQNILLVFGAAALSYYTVEKPFLRLREIIAARRKTAFGATAMAQAQAEPVPVTTPTPMP